MKGAGWLILAGLALKLGWGPSGFWKRFVGAFRPFEEQPGCSVHLCCRREHADDRHWGSDGWMLGPGDMRGDDDAS